MQRQIQQKEKVHCKSISVFPLVLFLAQSCDGVCKKTRLEEKLLQEWRPYLDCKWSENTLVHGAYER